MEMEQMRMSRLPGFFGTFIKRFFKGGQEKRDGADVRIEASPDPIHAAELHHPHPVKLTSDGEGPLFYRHYAVDFESPQTSVESLMALIQKDFNVVCPQDLATFKKTSGSTEKLQRGDEFLIEITGPWNGPVRVIDVTPQSFSLATLEGHMEAGEIRFELKSSRPGFFRFDIFSWARSQSAAVHLVYDKLKIAKMAQTEMWTLLCENIVKISNGQQKGDVLIETKEAPFRVEPVQVQSSAPQSWSRYQDRLKALEALKINFDLGQRDTFTVSNGWSVDEYRCDLPAEAPGPAQQNGSFETAKKILQNYEFPDPDLIQGIFKPEDPLEKRLMLLKAQFLGFNFYFGVRIANLIDTIESSSEGDRQIWGYGYHTLEGHFERGEIMFEIRKVLSTGKVDFKISAFSKADRIANPFYRWGFKIFGRGLQLRFAHSSMQRMQNMVIQRADLKH